MERLMEKLICLKKSRNGINFNKIKSKALSGLQLTQKERSMFILFIATDEELKYYLEHERNRHDKEKRT